MSKERMFGDVPDFETREEREERRENTRDNDDNKSLYSQKRDSNGQAKSRK
jgi:hypothetical protein